MNTFLEKALILKASNEAYATAFIVRRTMPSSGKPGDKAIITKDGNIHGWIGGGCTQGIVLKEALESLRDGKPRFVSISPNTQENTMRHTKIYTMTCQSGGEVDVYIEPVLPKPHIVIFGNSHIAMALAKISKAMDYTVSVVMNVPDKVVFPTADNLYALADLENKHLHENSHLIVCTQGHGDVDALHKAIIMGKSYISFVASRKKANAIFADLRDRDVTFEQLTQIKTPAGLDIGAKLPEEVAVSILAQIIQEFRSEEEAAKPVNDEAIALNDDYYMNPVCNIPIQKSTAKYVLEHEGEKVYFCCDGCKVKFEKVPSDYIK